MATSVNRPRTDLNRCPMDLIGPPLELSRPRIDMDRPRHGPKIVFRMDIIRLLGTRLDRLLLYLLFKPFNSSQPSWDLIGHTSCIPG